MKINLLLWISIDIFLIHLGKILKVNLSGNTIYSSQTSARVLRYWLIHQWTSFLRHLQFHFFLSSLTWCGKVWCGKTNKLRCHSFSISTKRLRVVSFATFLQDLGKILTVPNGNHHFNCRRPTAHLPTHGSHFSGLTKFPDFSSIFSIFPVFFFDILLFFFNWKLDPF